MSSVIFTMFYFKQASFDGNRPFIFEASNKPNQIDSPEFEIRTSAVIIVFSSLLLNKGLSFGSFTHEILLFAKSTNC
jgi:hypothetical protein